MKKHTRFGTINLLIISKHLGCSERISLGRRGLAVLVLTLFVAIPGAALYTGYRYGLSQPGRISTVWEAQLNHQQEEIEGAKRLARENLDALALRLGQLQAHVIRLDALGQRLTRMAKLEEGEFDFENVPAQGGPESGTSLEAMGMMDFMATLDQLGHQLDDRGQQLAVLESVLMNHNLQAEVFPTGRPIKSGWLSSHYGTRTDPFSGRLEHHAGLDFAGKEGSEVIAVASGVVTWSGKRYGYGNLVEVNHGSGYVTRYAHNREVLVKVGDTVKKGQTIALMGSTGRSTGPHVHFEVRHNGRTVDPRDYIHAAR